MTPRRSARRTAASWIRSRPVPSGCDHGPAPRGRCSWPCSLRGGIVGRRSTKSHAAPARSACGPWSIPATAAEPREANRRAATASAVVTGARGKRDRRSAALARMSAPSMSSAARSWSAKTGRTGPRTVARRRTSRAACARSVAPRRSRGRHRPPARRACRSSGPASVTAGLAGAGPVASATTIGRHIVRRHEVDRVAPAPEDARRAGVGESGRPTISSHVSTYAVGADDRRLHGRRQQRLLGRVLRPEQRDGRIAAAPSTDRSTKRRTPSCSPRRRAQRCRRGRRRSPRRRRAAER